MSIQQVAANDQTPVEALRQQLEAFMKLRGPKPEGYRFCGNEDLVLKHGLVYQRSLALPPVQPVAKACFEQAYRLATRAHSRWIYCEGYALNKKFGLAINHAWVCRPGAPSEAVDLAWEDGTPEDTAYIGIPFRPEYVREVHRASGGRYYSVLDAPWLNYQLVTGKKRIEDVIRH